MSTERLRFSTSVLRLLGEELNPSPVQGILELIKNSYDADATNCIIELKGTHIPGGTIQISDDGLGMSSKEIREGWLVVGDSMKSTTNVSPGGRLLVGNKGLGRLSALRLGDTVTLISRPKSEPTKQFRVEIDWRKYYRVSVVEEIELEIVEEEREFGSKQGTDIIVKYIPSTWQKKDIERLARGILLLMDPFSTDTGFKAILKNDEFQELLNEIHSEYFSACDYHLSAFLDENGQATAQVKNSVGDILFSGNHKDISDDPMRVYGAPSATFELWEFLLSGQKFISKQIKMPAIREWLKIFGGVRLYHRKVRVLPFGEPNNDWLDMNLRRTQSPELRPSTNNSTGCILIEDPKGLLLQKTDRLGIVENDVFEELRRFASDVLNWMSYNRLKARDARKKTELERIHKEKEVADKEIINAIKNVPEADRPNIEDAIQKIKSAHESEVKFLNETAQLYYTLGTVGTTAAAFAHQTKHPLGAIVEDANTLEQWLGNPDKPPLIFDYCSKAAKRIQMEANAIYSFSEVTLKLLEHEKRHARRYAIHELITEAVELLDPYIKLREAKVDFDFAAEDPQIWCSKAAFEAIITNFLTNSLQAFIREDKEEQAVESKQRNILFRTKIIDKKVVLVVADSGPGIKDISIDDIWLPGKTTTVKGTGLGLSIVRDVITDLGGSIDAEAKSEFGGAKFTVILPVKE